ncbi:hypothetical protein RUM43_011052 [Polyplax serrata]|uniref:Uncharacterized protein n=1 Tax=Polyplax serrata TaxID=468196 RepID=A0AAN8P8I5_POLSC
MKRKAPCLFLTFVAVPVWGGHKEFHKRHKEFCEDTLLPPSDKAGLSPSSARLSPTLENSPSSPSSSDIDNQPASRVLPFLYLGNQKNAADLKLLQSLGVTRVLNVTSDLPGYHEAEGISYRKLPASDSGQQNLKQYFEEAFDFIVAIFSMVVSQLQAKSFSNIVRFGSVTDDSAPELF